MANRLRVAFIGCGGIATRQHAPAYQQLAGVEIVAACDVVPEKAAAFTDAFGGRPYTDYREMLEEERPDIVDVCTREHQHVEPVIAALGAGAHVLCEKIMAHTLDGGRAMLAAADRSGRLLGVDYNYRFFPIFATLKALIDGGELGEIALINAYTHAFCFHHAVDLLRWLGQSCGPVTAVTGQYTATADPKYHFQVQCPDFVYVPSRNAALTLRFASGALGNITASRFEDLRVNMLRVDVVGERGRLTADGITTQDIMGRLVGTRANMVGASALVRTPEQQEIAYYDGTDRGFNVAFERSIRAFVERVQGVGTPAAATAATGQDGFAVLQIERALVLAAQEQRVVPLSDLRTTYQAE
jgi:predicted dehydrogenase